MSPRLTDRPLSLGLWGNNGHQIHRQLHRYPRLRLTALGALDETVARDLRAAFPEARVCKDYAEFLSVPGLELVSLCSPRRCDQADQAIMALEAGIHVYAEKPCATCEADLDRLLVAAKRGTAVFHEMAGSVCDQPYWTMRALVQRGVIGTVVQVSAQKSYPYHERRPTDEDVDGGLIAQNGVHALRFVEHVTGLRAVSIEALDTCLGEGRADSDLRMAAAMMGLLENGGLFSVVANYLNPTGFGSWGNEMLRIFGTGGMIESSDGGKRTRLIIGKTDHGVLESSETPPDWLDGVIAHAADGTPMPFDLETEIHPTRMVLRAKADADRRHGGHQ